MIWVGEFQIWAEYNCHIHLTTRQTEVHPAIINSLKSTASLTKRRSHTPVINQEPGYQLTTHLSVPITAYKTFLLSSFGIRQEQPGFLLCASQLTPSFSHSPQCQWLAFCVWGEWLSLGFLKQCLRQFRLVVLFLHVHFTWLVILSITGSRVWNIQLLIFNSSLLSSIQSVFAFMICMLLIIITSCCIKLMNM